ncbi:oxidative stress defense protein [Aliivibrio fischeri]|uniref:oxidative stress defense protein n=1 Tax=Aliivibrio fischeri TaxID=668 RepID=UPI0012DAD49A|nr:oxidative stress defense protein [Aliivibrio fischeri]MUK71040.1 oxidative stress defense protein [Aliivibrio fischeri]MUK74313.1 oxidative stress defense protein [Aliivibrio fischeri]
MKKIISVLCLSAFLTPVAMAASPDFPHLEVSGKGEVLVVPDMAQFSVDVVESKATAEKAKQAADKAVTGFLARLEVQGVKRENINSGNIRLTPEYRYPKGKKPELVGYKATRNITVTVMDLNKLNGYLDKALGEGINRINHIELKTSKEKQYIEAARLEAIKDANEKAASLAKGFGTSVKGVWKVSYHNNYSQPVLMRSMAMDSAANTAESYQDNQMVISDSVSVVYRLN